MGEAVAAWLGQEDKYNPDTMRVENAFGGPCPWRFGPDGKPLAGAAKNSYVKKCMEG